MAIRSLYKDYFQKSRVFLYPALKIQRGSSITPIETYIAWEGQYTLDDKKLICLYYLRKDPEFRHFEKTKLLDNPLFDNFMLIDKHTAVYVFSFEKFEEDWDNFLKGKYSKLSKPLKSSICDFFRKSTNNYAYIESFIYPERFFDMYARILYAPEDHNKGIRELKIVGELCSLPDLSKEILTAKIKNLDIRKIIT
jgi:hypothetical protein